MEPSDLWVEADHDRLEMPPIGLGALVIGGDRYEEDQDERGVGGTENAPELEVRRPPKNPESSSEVLLLSASLPSALPMVLSHYLWSC